MQLNERRIKFRHIQCFVEINRQKSLKLAAEKLLLTQPAISKTMKELEEILEAKLLIRNRGGIELTKQGGVFLHFAEISLASLRQGMDGVSQINSGGKTRLAVGALPSVSARLMPKVVEQFLSVAPDVTLRISDGPHSYLIDQLRQGKLDLVIGRMGSNDSMHGISFTQLYYEHVDFIVRPGHPMLECPDLLNLKNWPIIYPDHGSAIRPLVDNYMITNGVGHLSNCIETVSGAFGQIYVKKSDAIWIISAGVVANEVANGVLVRLPIDTGITTGAVGLMHRADAERSPQVRLFHMAVEQALIELEI